MTRQWCEIWQKISVPRRQRRLEISRMKDIDSVFELSGVAFRPVPPYSGLLVSLLLQNESSRCCHVISGIIVDAVCADVFVKADVSR